MDEDEGFLCRDRLRPLRRIGQCLAVQYDPGAMGPRVLRLHQRGAFRHDDGRRDAETLGVVGDRLGVVPRRHGNDAAGTFVRGKAFELRERAALLERARRLHVLVLDEDRRPGELRQARGRNERGSQNLPADRGGGPLDVLDIDRVARRACHETVLPLTPAAASVP